MSGSGDLTPKDRTAVGTYSPAPTSSRETNQSQIPMPYSSINLSDKLTTFDDHWAPRVIAEMNDYQFKVVKLLGEFVWHKHDDTDETFIVLEGSLTVVFRDGEVTLEAGEMFVIPKGIEHKPIANQEVKAMIIEPRGVVNTGEANSDLKAENNVWI